ncbi:MAG: glycosyltransferase family 4 protein [Deltaproteobacteria bacterium]|nr:glycosyltransferase family 4 protein [Deltaproteobacteria bacterium]
MTRIHRIAVLGNYLPRQCGIATFTQHLSDAICTEFPILNCSVLAMNDSGKRYAYPDRVRFEIEAAEISSYHRAADFLNVGDVDLVSVQHEYGIFGGKEGSHVLAMLRELRMPIVTTLHTVLSHPSKQQRLVMDEITRISERLVVMSVHGATLLQEVHGVSDEKIDVIPHGIPNLPDSMRSKTQLGVEGKQVILTFGLLAPDKGIENVIDALPEILKQYPRSLYIILGVTHPHEKEKNGEAYRVMLENRAVKLGVDANVVFHNRFVSQTELNSFLSAADIYITPYLNPEQITSGTLAYALGVGKAVISTPYSYARELLAEGRGVLVPWPKDDPRGISNAVIGILGDKKQRATYRKLGAAYGQNMRWPNVARAYIRSFDKALENTALHLRASFHVQTLADRPIGLPEINLDHLMQLSDDTGILQHAVFNTPRYDDGYCLDDNARAFLLTSLIEETGVWSGKRTRALASRYLAFIAHAFEKSTGRFKNFMSYSRQWADGSGSEDSHGRALWALGSVIKHSESKGRRNLADALFHDALPIITSFTSPRAWAYALLGMDEYLCVFGGDRDVQSLYRQISEKLFDLYKRTSTPEWPWFEDRATYCNARMSQALLLCGARMENSAMIASGLKSLEWLSEIQTSHQGEGWFTPIGSNGFYPKGGIRAAFDEQPVEVYAMISACLVAQSITGEGHWIKRAHNAFNWFLGQNRLQQSLYDAATGGCRDGLHADRPNENQGAESTLSFLMALCEMRAATLVLQPGNNELTLSNPAETKS